MVDPEAVTNSPAERTTEAQPPPQDIDREIAAAWVALLPTAAVLFLSAKFAAPLLAPAQVADPAVLFLSRYVEACAPERPEQIRYLLAIAIAPLSFVGAFLSCRRVPGEKLLPLAWAAQAALAAVIVYACASEAFGYFSPGVFVCASAATIGTAVLTWRERNLDTLVGRVTQRPQRVAAAIGVLATMAFLTPTIMRDAELYRAPIVTWYHLEHTAAEFFAVVGGRTPLVDFFPQYSNLLPILIAPIFAAIGSTTFGYTLVMAVLSLAGLLAIFWGFHNLIGNAWGAIALYLPLLGLAFYHGGPEAYAPSSFTYYAVWPIRYLWPMLCFGFLASTLRQPTLWRWVALGAFAGAGVINNVDFGVPGLVGCLAGLIFARHPRPVRSVAAYCGAALLGLVAIQLVYVARAGSWPDFAQVATFSKAFALHGFFMIPLPAAGLYWIVYLSFMACLFLAAARWWCGVRNSVYSGLLAFAGIFGSGAMMYYVGRSHPAVLTAVFVAWALAIMLLCFGFQQDFRRARFSRMWTLTVVPGLLLVFLYSLFAAHLLPNSWPLIAQFERFRAADASATDDRPTLKSFIARNVRPGERVVLAVPLGSRFAIDLGLRDVFPFPHPGAMILKEQAEELGKAIESNGVETLFISPGYDEPAEVQQMFRQLRLKHVKSAEGVNLWRRVHDYSRLESVVGAAIDFGAGGNSEAFRLAGWSGPEPGMTFTWTNGVSAELVLPVADYVGPLALRITAGAFIHPPDLPAQLVEVYMQDRKVAELSVAHLADYDVAIPADAVRDAGGVIALELRLPHAVSPSSLGVGADSRALGIYVARIRVLPGLVGKVIDFGDGGNSETFRLGGWSGPEKGMTFTWTNGNAAELLLPIPAHGGGPLGLRITGGAFIHPPELPSQHLEIHLHGRKVDQIAVSALAEYDVALPGDVVAESGAVLNLEFRLPNAAAPSELGAGPDSRKLGIYIARIRVIPSFVGKTVQFGAGGKSEEIRVSGWSGPEPGMTFTWSHGTSAKLALPVPGHVGPLSLKFHMGGLTSPPRIPFQPVTLYANGRAVAEWQVGAAEADFFATVPAEIINGRSILDLELALPQATSPMSLGSGPDFRQLAIYLVSVEVAEPERAANPAASPASR